VSSQTLNRKEREEKKKGAKRNETGKQNIEPQRARRNKKGHKGEDMKYFVVIFDGEAVENNNKTLNPYSR
jgi:hypothetical protein